MKYLVVDKNTPEYLSYAIIGSVSLWGFLFGPAILIPVIFLLQGVIEQGFNKLCR